MTVGKVEAAGRKPRRFAFAPKGADREMEPIKDMPHRLSGRSPYQIGKDRLTITDHGNFLAGTPPLRDERGAECRGDRA